MTIKIKPETQHFIEEQMKAGRYSSPEDVVQAGLRLLEEQESSLRGVKEKIAIGLAQARRGELLDGDAVFDEILRSIDHKD